MFVRFLYKANWFVFSQTEGEPIEIPAIPDWDRPKALSVLAICEVPFEHMDGNCMGYARKREIAINPLNQMPHKTTFHSQENHRLAARYTLLRTAIRQLYPEVFADVREFYHTVTLDDAEEMTREVDYILEVLENMNASASHASEADSNQDSTFNPNNAPFSKEEQKYISERLDEIENYLIRMASDQTDMKDDLADKVDFIKSEIDDIRKAASQLGRKDWRAIFINTILAITIAMGFAPDARQNLLKLLREVVNFIRNIPLLNP